MLPGCGVLWAMVSYATLRQRLTPAHLQGRTSAAANVAFNVPQLLGTVTATAVIGFIDCRVLIRSTVAIVLLSVLPARPRRRVEPVTRGGNDPAPVLFGQEDVGHGERADTHRRMVSKDAGA